MPVGTCTIRIQNNTNQTITNVDFDVVNGTWNQQPPATVAAGASSGNFQMSYNFPVGGQSDFDMRYSLPNEATPFTAAAIIEQPGPTVICTPSGAGPGQHHVTFVVTGAAPSFNVLFTFN